MLHPFPGEHCMPHVLRGGVPKSPDAALGSQAADVARSHFQGASNVTVVDDVPIDDGWTRDWGPSVRARCCLPALALCCRAARCTACHRVELLSLEYIRPAEVHVAAEACHQRTAVHACRT